MMDGEFVPVQTRKYNWSLRLTFAYEGTRVELSRVEELEMIAPPSVSRPPTVGESSGYWAEIRDARGQLLFHRLMRAPLGTMVEHHSPDGKIELVSGPPGNGVFELLVPAISGAATVVLFGDVDTKSVSAEFARFSISSTRTKEGA